VTNRFFWIVASILLAIIVHVSVVLFAARVKMPARFDILGKAGSGGFQVFTPDMLQRFDRRPLKHMIYGGCLVAPGKGRVELKAPIEPGYWSVTLYSAGGDVLYTLNDLHAGVKAMTIVFQLKDDDSADAIQAPRLRNGKLLVPLDVERALAVTQAYVAHPGERRRKLESLSRTTCTAYPTPLMAPKLN